MGDETVDSGASMTARRNLARASTAVLAMLGVLVVWCAGTALAAEPAIVISQPHTGSSTNNQTPAFSGTSTDTLDAVTLDIYAGEGAVGTPVQEATMLMPVEVGPAEATWEIVPAAPLAPGQYTALAVQTNSELETGKSSPVTFTVDTTSPAVSINALASLTNDPTPTLSGGAGVEAGDAKSVTVTIYDGASVGGPVAASAGVTPSLGAWSFEAPHLSDGTYTAQATESDEAGNVGKSGTVTFTVDTTPPAVSINPVAPFTKDARPKLGGGAGCRARRSGTVPGQCRRWFPSGAPRRARARARQYSRKQPEERSDAAHAIDNEALTSPTISASRGLRVRVKS